MTGPGPELHAPWNVSPDALNPLDAALVRFISDGLSDDITDRLLGPDGFSVRRRMASLMAKHVRLQCCDLLMLAPERRRAIAESVILAELAEMLSKSDEGSPDLISGEPPAAPKDSPCTGLALVSEGDPGETSPPLTRL